MQWCLYVVLVESNTAIILDPDRLIEIPHVVYDRRSRTSSDPAPIPLLNWMYIGSDITALTKSSRVTTIVHHIFLKMSQSVFVIVNFNSIGKEEKYIMVGTCARLLSKQVVKIVEIIKKVHSRKSLDCPPKRVMFRTTTMEVEIDGNEQNTETKQFPNVTRYVFRDAEKTKRFTHTQTHCMCTVHDTHNNWD